MTQYNKLQTINKRNLQEIDEGQNAVYQTKKVSKVSDLG